MNAAARATKELKFLLVFSQRRAMRLKRLSFPIICSMRARPRYRALANTLGITFVFLRNGITGTAPRARVLARFAALSVAWQGMLACPRRIALVRDDRAGADVGAKLHQRLKMRAVGCFSARQVKADGKPVMVCFQMDFCAKPAA